MATGIFRSSDGQSFDWGGGCGLSEDGGRKAVNIRNNGFQSGGFYTLLDHTVGAPIMSKAGILIGIHTRDAQASGVDGTRAALSAVGIAADLSPEKAARQLTRQVTREQVHLPLPTLSQLQTIAPRFPAAWVQPLHDAIRLAHITQPRLPMFLAQLAHAEAEIAARDRRIALMAEGERRAAQQARQEVARTRPRRGLRDEELIASMEAIGQAASASS